MLASKFITENPDFLKDLNREQLAVGQYTSGETIQDGYSAMWQRERMRVNKQIRFVDLNYTGEFYNNIEVRTTPNTVIFHTQDPKFARLSGLFPGGFLGLNEENAGKVALFTANGIRNGLMEYLKT